jgi:hypothetical protein
MESVKVRWGVVSAICLGVWLAMWLLGGDREPDAATVPCRSGHIIANGFITASPDHPTFREVGGLLLVVHKDGIPGQLIALYHGKHVEIVIREVK